MKTYEAVKAELKTQTRETLKYFTKGFFRLYLDTLEEIRRNDENGLDTAYYDETIQGWSRREWDKIRSTDFYKKTSCAYCSFLCIMCK